MPMGVPPVADEREGLLAFLAQQRYALKTSAYGLSDKEARTTTTASSLTVGGLIKHSAWVEKGWIELVKSGDTQAFGDFAAYQANFALADGETLSSVLAGYEEVEAATESVIARIDLGKPVPVPKGVPWFPDDVEAWSVRWVMLHLVEETARHAGHADIVRECLDRATAGPLMAAAENWEPTEWMKPWERQLQTS